MSNLERVVWKVETDGGCPANPGPGAFAFVIRMPNDKIVRSGFLPHATNNQAEYRAVHAAAFFLNKYLDSNLAPDEVEFWSDSQVIVRQLNGVYKVNDELRPFYSDAQEVIKMLRFKVRVKVDWFRREFNSEADELCNQVLAKRGVEIVSKRKVKQVAALSQ